MLSAKPCVDADTVCLSVADVKDLAWYMDKVHETRNALAGCALVDLVP